MATFTFLTALRRSIGLFCFCLTAIVSLNATPTGLALNGPSAGVSTADWLEPFLKHAEDEFRQLERVYVEETEPMRMRLFDIRNTLEDPRNRTPERGFELMWEKSHLEETLFQIEANHELKVLKLRYRKSVEIVKMLYEKVLAMDHHFSSLKAQQGLSTLSNPHNYPEFKETRGIIEDRMKKKFGFELPGLLQGNPYLSAAFSIVGLVTGGGDEKEKKRDIDKIACVLDFTVRMHNDLNLIYYETGYLRDHNLTLKKECESLFGECARQVGYTIPLTSCRDGDDWERLYGMLDTYVGKALGETQPATGTGTTGTGGYNTGTGGYNTGTGGYNNGAGGTNTGGDPRLIQRVTANLQFSIDRVAQFIEKYGEFVGQGGEYYKKFSKIASSYENEKLCIETLPDQFKQLKEDIGQTLEKFNSAYRMPEVQGSKLKDMLYGVSSEE